MTMHEWKRYRSLNKLFQPMRRVVVGMLHHSDILKKETHEKWRKPLLLLSFVNVCSALQQHLHLRSLCFLHRNKQGCATTAAAGIHKATEPRRLLARIWVLIGVALDGDIQQLGNNSALVWVPAHTSPSAVGEVKRSDTLSV